MAHDTADRIAKAREVVARVYRKPEPHHLFDLAGADPETMQGVGGHEGVKLRTLVAYRVRLSQQCAFLTCLPLARQTSFLTHPSHPHPQPTPTHTPHRPCTSRRSSTTEQ